MSLDVCSCPDFLCPVTVPAWVLSDLFMVANVSPLRAKAEEAVEAAGRALDAAKVPVCVGPQGPPSGVEGERSPSRLARQGPGRMEQGTSRDS